MNQLFLLFQSRKLTFDQIGIYVFFLMIVAWFGFGPSYFHRIISDQVHFSFYFHFHASSMVLWIAIAFLQPVFIRYGKVSLHKNLGRVSFLVFPLVIISTLMLVHSQLQMAENIDGATFFIPVKDVLLMSVFYVLAIIRKKNIGLHARLMVATMVPMIEPSLVRMLFNVLPEVIVEHSYIYTILIIDCTLLLLVWYDHKRPKFRWVFTSVLIYMLLVQFVLMSNLVEHRYVIGRTNWFASI